MTNPHEDFCLNNADHFTAVRGRARKDRTKVICKTLQEAEAVAAKFGDSRTMIYAVSAAGHSAHIKNA